MAGTDGTATYPWLNVPSETADGAEPKPATGKADVVAPVPRVCLSRSEAARALGIGLSTLKRMEQTREAPPYFDAPGGRRLYPVRSLIEWAEQRAGSVTGQGT